MRPYGYCEGNMYEITTYVNDEKLSVVRAVAEQFPYESELEMVNRMGTELIRGLRDKEKHDGCCDCCEKKKKCPKY